MQIIRVAHTWRLGSQAKFVLGPDDSKSTKTFTGQNNYWFGIAHMTVKWTSFLIYHYAIKCRCIERYVALKRFL